MVNHVSNQRICTGAKDILCYEVKIFPTEYDGDSEHVKHLSRAIVKFCNGEEHEILSTRTLKLEEPVEIDDINLDKDSYNASKNCSINADLDTLAKICNLIMSKRL